MRAGEPALATRVAVVGLHGGRPYGDGALRALASSGLVVGSPRHLDATAAIRPTATPILPLTGPLQSVLDRVEEAMVAGIEVCVLASGDPGFFGIVRALGQRVSPGRLVVHPAPSSVALAFARIGVPWDDALVVSAHGRSLEDAVDAIMASVAPSVAVLTAPANPPQMLGRALLAAGATGAEVVVASHLGDAGETVAAADLPGLATGNYDPMSVVVLRHLQIGHVPIGPVENGDVRAGLTATVAPLAWGLPEAAFDHRDGMITKAEVRAVVLGKLAVPVTGVLWDVGAGSGSVAVECARLAPALRVLAIERDPEQAQRIRTNAGAHGVNVEVVDGAAPDALAALPDPDRVFVGGGGLDVLDEAMRRLRPGGVVVATFAVVERALGAAARLGNLVQLSISRGVPTGELGLRLRAENPVFLAWGPG